MTSNFIENIQLFDYKFDVKFSPPSIPLPIYKQGHHIMQVRWLALTSIAVLLIDFNLDRVQFG